MVREASRRKQKYEAKIDADVIRSRILAHKASMVEQMESRLADLATVEAEVKRVIEGDETPPYGHEIPAYLNVGRELYRISKRFTGGSFTQEAEIVLDKWYARGLKDFLLEEIAKLFGKTWTAP